MKAYRIENPLYRYKKLIFIFILTFLTVIVTISNYDNIEEAFLEISNIKLEAVIALSILLVVYLLIDAIILQKAIGSDKINFTKSFVINMAGSFFSAITPMYIGSYPSRIYYLHKEGIPVDYSLSSLTVKGITYQLIISIVAVISLFIVGPVLSKSSFDMTLIVIGFLYNLLMTTFLVLISSSKKVNVFVYNLIAKVTLKIKGLGKKRDNILASIDDYYTSTRKMYTDRKYFLLVFGYTLLKIIMHNVFPIIVFYGLDIDISGYYLYIFTMSSLMGIIVSVFPTPGGMVASEAAFLVFFKLLFDLPGVVEAGLLIWRFFTYYIVVILGLIATLYLQTKEPKARKEF